MTACVRVAIALLLFALANGQACGDYGYVDGQSPPGPSFWGDICTAFATCKTGTQQSPIDIRSSLVSTEYYSTPLTFGYSAGEIEDMKVNNLGHTVRVDIPTGGAPQLLSGGSLSGTYKLLQVHFHTGSEHTIEGVIYKLELHFVHQSITTGGLAVVGVMFTEGASSAFLEEWEHVLSQVPSIGNVTLLTATLTHGFPADKETNWWSYDGSLTTPPCSEGVKWTVLKTPLTATAEQIEAFGALVHHNDRRPVQGLGSRTIKTYRAGGGSSIAVNTNEETRNKVAIGLGVGLGVGIPFVLALAIIAFCLIRGVPFAKTATAAPATAAASTTTSTVSSTVSQSNDSYSEAGSSYDTGDYGGEGDEEEGY